MTQLILILMALLFSAAMIHRWAGLNRNITLLFLAQPLITATAPLMVFVGGLIAQPLAPQPSWATLPLTLMIAGTAVATIPAALLARHFGRRVATQMGFSGAVCGGILAFWSVQSQWFWGFALAAFVMGFSGAFAQQLRFAAIESLSDSQDIPKAVSVLMLTGIFAAMIGPEMAYVSHLAFKQSVPYAGAFLGVVLMALVAIFIVGFIRPPDIEQAAVARPARAMRQIIKQPVFVVAIVAAALGFGLMSFVMTATPLSMHQLHDHSLQHTKWVIQSHVAAMYLPSLITIWLGKKVDVKYFLLVGTLMFVGVVIIASQGHQLLHYWWALILLGIGWNFLFYAGTTLLPLSYEPQERHRVQAVNDFSVFTFQGLSSLMAGWVLYHHQWQGVLITCVPFVLIMLLITVWHWRKQ